MFVYVCLCMAITCQPFLLPLCCYIKMLDIHGKPSALSYTLCTAQQRLFVLFVFSFSSSPGFGCVLFHPHLWDERVCVCLSTQCRQRWTPRFVSPLNFLHQKRKKKYIYIYIMLIRSFLLCVCVCLLWKKRYINSSEKTQCVCFRSCAYVLVYAAVGNRLHALQIAAVLTHRSTVVFFIFWVLFFLFLFFFDYGDCCFGRRKTVTVTFYAKICVCVSAFLISGDFSTSFA